MSTYLTKEQIAAALDNPKKHSPEELKKAAELGKKMRASSYEERRASRMKMDEERGYCD
ncbi:MAG: hypothetical protein IKT44_00045 [Clostridia bacterium]|nr:hypothetical protein [Clostridia bacterium]